MVIEKLDGIQQMMNKNDEIWVVIIGTAFIGLIIGIVIGRML